MIRLTHRSDDKELLDADNVPFADIRLNMQELNTINTLLGGHRVTLMGLRHLIKTRDDQTLSICEIGCGGGDNLLVIYNWCTNHGIKTKLTGIDIKIECINFCRQQYNIEVDWICSDYKDVLFEHKPDILFSSLFCHHFTQPELAFMVQWMKVNSNNGFFINDLHRHILAYYSIRILTKMFSKSYLVKNDAPLSVKRGFKRTDWENIFRESGITTYSIQWKWAFRYLIVCQNESVD